MFLNDINGIVHAYTEHLIIAPEIKCLFRFTCAERLAGDNDPGMVGDEHIFQLNAQLKLSVLALPVKLPGKIQLSMEAGTEIPERLTGDRIVEIVIATSFFK